MKKKIIIAATFTACLALCAAVWPQNEAVEETTRPERNDHREHPQSDG